MFQKDKKMGQRRSLYFRTSRQCCVHHAKKRVILFIVDARFTSCYRFRELMHAICKMFQLFNKSDSKVNMSISSENE